MQLVPRHNETVLMKGNLLQVIAIHLVTFGVAPFFFTWRAFALAFGLTLFFGYAMGIFHHMLLTHRSFQCRKWLEYLGTLFGALTWRGPFAGPVRYVAMHRIHHAHSDTELDPHTPTKGILFALLIWFWRMPHGFSAPEYYDGYAPDMAKDPVHVFMDRHPHLLQLGWGILCFAVAATLPLFSGHPLDLRNGARYLVYGVFVRAFLTLYLVNLVDVINHTVGYRSYETSDNSTNSFIMAGIHLGGAVSWHNNHHAHQYFFHVRKNWWEFDAHYQFLRGLQLLGLVSNIRVRDELARAPAAAEQG